MPRRTTRLVSLVLLFLVFAAVTAVGRNHKRDNFGSAPVRLSEEVRHNLAMLPYYGVFDNLEFRIQGLDTVVLSGQVTRPTLRSDAANAVRRSESVGKVINNIKVLPLSPDDDRIRLAEYRAIYSNSGLNRYSRMPLPSIHIIVDNGHVTLTGTVASKADKDLAYIVSNSVPGVFSVTNDLNVERPNS